MFLATAPVFSAPAFIPHLEGKEPRLYGIKGSAVSRGALPCFYLALNARLRFLIIEAERARRRLHEALIVVCVIQCVL